MINRLQSDGPFSGLTRGSSCSCARPCRSSLQQEEHCHPPSTLCLPQKLHFSIPSTLVCALVRRCVCVCVRSCLEVLEAAQTSHTRADAAAAIYHPRRPAVSLPFVLRNPPGISEACDDDNDDVIREPRGCPLTVALWDEP